MENLASYLKASKMTQSAFAKIVGVKQPTVHRWLNNLGRPSWGKASEIERITNGAVPVSAWADKSANGAAA